MTDLLSLEERLGSTECTKLIIFIANGTLPWKFQLIRYLVVKSDMPGSGVAVTLCCDLSRFSWNDLLQKQEIDLEMVQAIVSLKGPVTLQDIFTIVHVIDSKKFTILNFTISHCTQQLKDHDLIHLYKFAIKWKKDKFAEEIMDYSLTTRDVNKLILVATAESGYGFVEKLLELKQKSVNPTLLVDELPITAIKLSRNLISCVLSTPEGRAQLLLKAIQYHEFQLAEDCLKIPRDKTKLDLSHVLQEFHMNQVTRDRRQQFLSFIKKLLDMGIDSNGQDSKLCPLDIVLKLSNEYHNEKMELMISLLEHGADIGRCTYEKEKQTTLIHAATKLAIDSGRLF